jgi:hypothetical protein
LLFCFLSKIGIILESLISDKKQVTRSELGRRKLGEAGRDVIHRLEGFRGLLGVGWVKQGVMLSTDLEGFRGLLGVGNTCML